MCERRMSDTRDRYNRMAGYCYLPQKTAEPEFFVPQIHTGTKKNRWRCTEKNNMADNHVFIGMTLGGHHGH